MLPFWGHCRCSNSYYPQPLCLNFSPAIPIQSCYLTSQRLPLKWWQITPKYAITPISVFLDHGILPQGLHSAADSAPVHPKCICNLIDRHGLLALAQQSQNFGIQVGTALHNLSLSGNLGVVAVRRVVSINVELHPDVPGRVLSNLEVTADNNRTVVLRSFHLPAGLQKSVQELRSPQPGPLHTVCMLSCVVSHQKGTTIAVPHDL